MNKTTPQREYSTEHELQELQKTLATIASSTEDSKLKEQIQIIFVAKDVDTLMMHKDSLLKVITKMYRTYMHSPFKQELFAELAKWEKVLHTLPVSEHSSLFPAPLSTFIEDKAFSRLREDLITLLTIDHPDLVEASAIEKYIMRSNLLSLDASWPEECIEQVYAITNHIKKKLLATSLSTSHGKASSLPLALFPTVTLPDPSETEEAAKQKGIIIFSSIQEPMKNFFDKIPMTDFQKKTYQYVRSSLLSLDVENSHNTDNKPSIFFEDEIKELIYIIADAPLPIESRQYVRKVLGDLQILLRIMWKPETIKSTDSTKPEIQKPLSKFAQYLKEQKSRFENRTTMLQAVQDLSAQLLLNKPDQDSVAQLSSILKNIRTNIPPQDALSIVHFLTQEQTTATTWIDIVSHGAFGLLLRSLALQELQHSFTQQDYNALSASFFMRCSLADAKEKDYGKVNFVSHLYHLGIIVKRYRFFEEDSTDFLTPIITQYISSLTPLECVEIFTSLKYFIHNSTLPQELCGKLNTYSLNEITHASSLTEILEDMYDHQSIDNELLKKVLINLQLQWKHVPTNKYKSLEARLIDILKKLKLDSQKVMQYLKNPT